MKIKFIRNFICANNNPKDHQGTEHKIGDIVEVGTKLDQIPEAMKDVAIEYGYAVPEAIETRLEYETKVIVPKKKAKPIKKKSKRK